MILKEFGLAAPQVATDTRVAFARQCRCVTALFEKHFPAVRTDGWKILTEVVAVPRDDSVRDGLGVLSVEIAGEPDRFLLLSKEEKKREALRLLWRGIEKVLLAKHLSPEPFLHARLAVEQCDYKNEWTWKRPVRNPSRSLTASLWCVHDVERFKSWIVIKDENGGELTRVQVIDQNPSEFEFVGLLGKLRWEGGQKVVLESKNGQEVGSAVITNNHDGGTQKNAF